MLRKKKFVGKHTNVRAAVALSQSSSKVITVLVVLLAAQLAVVPVRLLWDSEFSHL